MEVEKTGTTYKCPKCKHKWDWEDTHCPNCGSDEFVEDEIHLGDNWRERGENDDAENSKFAIQRVSNSVAKTCTAPKEGNGVKGGCDGNCFECPSWQ